MFLEFLWPWKWPIHRSKNITLLDTQTLLSKYSCVVHYTTITQQDATYKSHFFSLFPSSFPLSISHREYVMPTARILLLFLFVRFYVSALNVVCWKHSLLKYSTWKYYEAVCKPINENVHWFSQSRHASVVTGTPAWPQSNTHQLTLHLFFRKPAEKQNAQNSALLRLLRRYYYVLIGIQRFNRNGFNRNEVKTSLVCGVHAGSTVSSGMC